MQATSESFSLLAQRKEQTHQPPAWAMVAMILAIIGWISLLVAVVAIIGGIANNWGGAELVVGAAAAGGALLLFFGASALRWLQLIEWRLRRPIAE